MGAAMGDLTDKIHATIARTGAISIAEYMAQCLFHPDLGYYTRKTGFGRGGDFVTAPEISQAFGEVLGLCLAQSWLDSGAPRPFVLAELGGGSGQLMTDILRATRGVAGFHAGLQLWMVEASPSLHEVQKIALGGVAEITPQWCDNVGELPDLPLFLIANEFFDCLPIRQYQRKNGKWHERMITSTETPSGKALAFCLGGAVALKGFDEDLPEDSVIELCPAAVGITEGIARHIGRLGGTAILIDYGRWGALGSTLQAVRDHKKTDPLADAGLADISALVDFRAISKAAQNWAQVSALMEQGVLLERLGLGARMEQLAKNLTGEALKNHTAAHHRLTDAGEMGSLFKALAITAKTAPLPDGFEPAQEK